MSSNHLIVKAAIGSALGVGESRRRLRGRIGGIVGFHTPEADERLRSTLGHGAQVLSSAEQLLIDADSVLLDECPLITQAAWRQALAGDRLPSLTGAFALAWADSEGSLHLARDGVGERTLFYAECKIGFVFGSSIRAVLATGLVPRRINRRAVATYLTYAYLPGRETLAEGVFELLPGEHLIIRDRQIKRQLFWTLPGPPASIHDQETLTQQLRERLETAMRRLLPSVEEPVGATLSGGLDSSLVVALARKLHPAPVYTFSVSFGAEFANELPFSSQVAEHCRTDHRIVELSPAVVLHYLDQSIAILSDPIGDPLTVPNALLFREAAQHVGVVLNGEGGDPCFGGPKNLPMVLAELYSHGSKFSREASYLRAHLKCYDELAELLSGSVRHAITSAPLEDELAEFLNDARWPDFVGRLQSINIRLKGGHHILPKVDALSFPFGVVPRAPLFDRGVVEHSLSIPANLKLHGSIEKYLLKRAVADLLPKTILERPKSGMLVPVEGWFKGPLLPAARERLLDGLTQYDICQRPYLERLLAGNLGGLRPRHGAKIWLLVTLEAWLRSLISGDKSTS